MDLGEEVSAYETCRTEAVLFRMFGVEVEVERLARKQRRMGDQFNLGLDLISYEILGWHDTVVDAAYRKIFLTMMEERKRFVMFWGEALEDRCVREESATMTMMMIALSILSARSSSPRF